MGNWEGGAAYGAGGSLILLLFWIYLSAQILLFGAEFTQTYANKYGSRLILQEGFMQVTHKPYERPQPSLSPPPPVPDIETPDPPSRQRQKQVAFGLFGLAIGLLLGFLGSLQRRS